MLGTNKLAVAGETVTLEKEVMDRVLLGGGFWVGLTISCAVSLMFILLLNLFDQ